MNPYHTLELDENGHLILRDREDELIALANAKYNKTQSSAVGPQRPTRSGNPWYNPSDGRFANGPAGVNIKAGGALLKNLLNTSKQFISNQASRLSADGLSATQDSNGRIIITLWKGNDALIQFSVPTQAANPEDAQVGHDVADVSGQPQPHSLVPDNVDPEEWARRMDAVRDAAREFDDLSQQDVREWLAGKTNRDLSDHEINAFVQDVKFARLSDLVDVLDNSIRRRVALRSRNRRMVRVVPPRGWLRKTLANLEDGDIAQLYQRLQGRGFSDEELQTHLINRYDEDRRGRLVALVGEPTTTGKNAKDISGSTNRREKRS